MNTYDLDLSVNLMRHVLWQYDGAENLVRLLQQDQDWYDENVKGFWDDWFRDVYDLSTANDFGLSVWAIILGVPLIGPAGSVTDGVFWGFGQHSENFGNGNFAGSGGTIPLQTEQKRLVLKLRYYKMTSGGRTEETNAFLADIFADQGPAYVIDNFDMTCTFVFGFELDASIRYILDKMDILPRPSGVNALWEAIPVCPVPSASITPTVTASLDDNEDTFSASVSDCEPYVILLESFSASANDLTVTLDNVTGDMLYQVYVNGTLSTFGTAVDGVIWGPSSPFYSTSVELKIVIFSALLADSGTADVVCVGGIDESAEALFERMAVEPSPSKKKLINDTIVALKAAGVWEKLDSLQVYRIHTEQAALLDWVDTDRTATNAGMTFTANSEIKGGTGLYLRTGFVPSTGPNFTLNDASFGVFVTSARSSGGSSYAGSQTAASSNSRIYEGGAGASRRMSALLSQSLSDARIVVGAPLIGFMHGQRVSATEIEAYYNELTPGTETSNSNTLSSVEMYVGAVNDNGTAAAGLDAGFGAFWAGAALTSGEIDSLRTIIQNYMENLI